MLQFSYYDIYGNEYTQIFPLSIDYDSCEIDLSKPQKHIK